MKCDHGHDAFYLVSGVFYCVDGGGVPVDLWRGSPGRATTVTNRETLVVLRALLQQRKATEEFSDLWHAEREQRLLAEAQATLDDSEMHARIGELELVVRAFLAASDAVRGTAPHTPERDTAMRRRDDALAELREVSRIEPLPRRKFAARPVVEEREPRQRVGQ